MAGIPTIMSAVDSQAQMMHQDLMRKTEQHRSAYHETINHASYEYAHRTLEDCQWLWNRYQTKQKDADNAAAPAAGINAVVSAINPVAGLIVSGVTASTVAIIQEDANRTLKKYNDCMEDLKQQKQMDEESQRRQEEEWHKERQRKEEERKRREKEEMEKEEI